MYYDMSHPPTPINIRLLQKSKKLLIAFDDGYETELSCEYLRVFSPSAEVQGHGGEGGKLELNKQNVNITAIEPVGNYGVKLIFDDGHQTGIYTFEKLYALGKDKDANWQGYLHAVECHHAG